MFLESTLVTIKSVSRSKWRYTVIIQQSPGGTYVLTDTNSLTGKVKKTNFIDYNLANFTFNKIIDNYEGN